MKKATYFISLILTIIIIIPLIIVKGCSSNNIEQQKQIEGLTIKIYIKAEDKISEMDFEEYIKGVVAAEMPAEFEQAALEAQAIAARTYAFARMKKIYSAKEDTHSGANICSEPGHCQAWVSKQDSMKKWGIFSAFKYWNKIEKAVDATRGAIIVYNNTIANPLFHSNSGGRTENAEEVWEGVAVPYLKSVESDGEDVTREFESSVKIETTEFINKLRNEYADIKLDSKDVMKDINIIAYTEGGRVKSIRIGNKVLKGTEFRKLYSLKSANFKLVVDGDSMIITTLGNGHGVGMSQWGANNLAKWGATCEEILKYYYKGVDVSTIEIF